MPELYALRVEFNPESVPDEGGGGPDTKLTGQGIFFPGHDILLCKVEGDGEPRVVYVDSNNPFWWGLGELEEKLPQVIAVLLHMYIELRAQLSKAGPELNRLLPVKSPKRRAKDQQ